MKWLFFIGCADALLTLHLVRWLKSLQPEPTPMPVQCGYCHRPCFTVQFSQMYEMNLCEGCFISLEFHSIRQHNTPTQ